MKLPVFLGSIVLSLALWSTAGATTVFSTDFAGGIAGWATSGNVDAHQGTLRLRGPASATRAVSTAGYSAVSVAFTMSAGSLENGRSDEHTSELQSPMRISYAVFCLKQNNLSNIHAYHTINISIPLSVHLISNNTSTT